MPGDVKLDQYNEEWVVIEGSVLKATTADLMLDAPSRRRPGGGPHRRALVHDQRDGLTINFNGDYPGGVAINSAHLNLAVVHQNGGEPQLPKAAAIGDVLMVVNTQSIGGTPIGTWATLWLCVPSAIASADASWQQIKLGDIVPGTV